MLSIDTNLLFYAFNSGSPLHLPATQWLRSIHELDEVAISEFILAEFYGLLRNPSVLISPLPAAEAAEVIEAYRRHPRWRVVGFAGEGRALHDALWRMAAQPAFPYRRLFDARTALTLRAHGVTEFATCNPKDFQGLGFSRVWNPILT
jgi:toxin-antitoxin system PIN domain toxin